MWLDTADGALAEQGLTLEVSKGRLPRDRTQRLLRTLPTDEPTWIPGRPAAPVPGHAALVAAVPIAAFSGRRTVFALDVDGTPVTATLRLGKLRAVTAERPAARLLLEGPGPAVLALARTLAADMALLPGPALAEEGRALARGEGVRPRRRGAPALGPAATVEGALIVAVGHLLEVLLHQAPACRRDAGPEGVHQMRVALRRLRSVLRAFRPAAGGPALEAFDTGLRDLGRLLGPARDFDVFLAGLGGRLTAAIPDDRRIAALIRAAEARRTAAYAALRTALDGVGFRRLVLEGLSVCLLQPWTANPDSQAELLRERLPPFASRLLDRRWDKLCERGEAIEELGADALHDLRLEAKKLRYAAELFAELWTGKTARKFLKRLSEVQETLGVANDVAVARALLASMANGVPAWAIGAAEGFCIAQSSTARADALKSWADVRLAKPFWSDV